MKNNTISKTFVALAGLALAAGSANAALLFNPIEFVEDDQAGFDLWPTAYAGTSSAAAFPSTGTISGTTTVTVTTDTTFDLVTNRGSVDGTPAGYSYQHLYEDILIASTPTGALTLDFSGLDASTTYRLTVYSWDPTTTTNEEKVWTVTGGTGVPTSDSVNFSNPLVDNQTFAMVFDITTTGGGTFELENTAGLPQSGINGFIIETIPEPSTAVLAVLGSLGLLSRRRR